MLEKHEYKENVGENLRQEREARKMSVEEVAKKLKVTPGYLRLIENGERSVTTSNLEKLSGIFEKPISTLIHGSLPVKKTDVNIKKDELNSLLEDVNDHELDFITKTIMGYRKMKHGNQTIMQ